MVLLLLLLMLLLLKTEKYILSISDQISIFVFSIRSSENLSDPNLLSIYNFLSKPGGPGFDSESRQPQVVAHQH